MPIKTTIAPRARGTFTPTGPAIHQGSIGALQKLQAVTYTPSDSPVCTDETKAIESLQEYANEMNNWVYPGASMSLAYFLHLTWAVAVLRRADIITAKCATTFCYAISTRYSRQPAFSK